jgi:uncharacterized membrane protein YgcG
MIAWPKRVNRLAIEASWSSRLQTFGPGWSRDQTSSECGRDGPCRQEVEVHQDLFPGRACCILMGMPWIGFFFPLISQSDDWMRWAVPLVKQSAKGEGQRVARTGGGFSYGRVGVCATWRGMDGFLRD